VDSAGPDRVNPTTSEFGRDPHGRPWTALTRSGNAVSGVTRIEGSNPSRSAKNPCAVRRLGTRELKPGDAISRMTAPTLTPTMTPFLRSANVGGGPWTGYRISAQSAALAAQPDDVRVVQDPGGLPCRWHPAGGGGRSWAPNPESALDLPTRPQALRELFACLCWRSLPYAAGSKPSAGTAAPSSTPPQSRCYLSSSSPPGSLCATSV
jgi:hypothetical protein